MSQKEIIKYCGTDGRLLIPKSMREALHFQGHEPLSLKLSGDCLVLEKYRTMENLGNLCQTYLKAFRKISACPIIICDTERIISTRGISFPSSYHLSDSLLKHLQEGISYTFSDKDSFLLFADKKLIVDCVFPIQDNHRPTGGVILLHLRDVILSEQLCAQFLAEILSEQLKNNEPNGGKDYDLRRI